MIHNLTPAEGSVIRVAGPVVEAKGMSQAVMHEMVEVGRNSLIGEIIRLEGEYATIQIYQNTSGLKLNEPVTGTGNLLSVELGPGLIGGVFDGIQRPLESIRKLTGPFIKQTHGVTALSREKIWPFQPKAKPGTQLISGDILGTVKETNLVEHHIMVPAGIKGKLVEIAPEGNYTIVEKIALIQEEGANGKKTNIPMLQRWPVRTPKPYTQRLFASTPLITGQRIIDTFFPIAKGGSAAIPGPFGAGKTIVQQQLAKWSDANVIIYVGCGERGNEMVEVLDTFPQLLDPTTGRPLMERTILIANTSNMPVSAREASIYTGITLAEYYRDMGYAVALMADSTSRWAEALREVSGRLEEMPAEEGFPSYLPSRLAEFYERTGVVKTIGTDNRTGSICAIGAISPPGGDFSEPVTQHTKRFTRVFWALDAELAGSRHYPAINWMASYSEYIPNLTDWWHKNVDATWSNYRDEAMRILQAEDELKNIVKLVGSEALPDKQRLTLETARIIRIAFLQQNALDQIDTYCSPQKQHKMLKIIIDFHHLAETIITKGAPIFKVTQLPVIVDIMRMKDNIPNNKLEQLDDVEKKMHQDMDNLVTTLG
ncbi:V-type ATP synthase subunit A [Candidatus Bathycorpusculum sp.]|uniref:V-type ATP synthase subunit A n=1 Tax=Candidatus Bathycorpusculum sp. TaxID=2994959 RepID=UPI002839C607|nr:V-type ATP synthase subunit A [Candidatus Termitimicrobium sp.]MCL2685256.1 V-type ATP synthase subunit A [Candidatus Termitimicrobium sp.]